MGVRKRMRCIRSRMAGTSFVANWSASMYNPRGSIEPSLEPGGSYVERKGRDTMATPETQENAFITEWIGGSYTS